MTMNKWIQRLNLIPHQEGGYYKQLYLNDTQITLSDGRQRALSSSILFLLSQQNPSHFHRLKSDEIWYFHYGHPLTVHMIDEHGNYQQITLGSGDTDYLQYTVPKNVIFGSSIESNDVNAFAIVSCMVSPAFDYQDFELFTQQQLLNNYPQHEKIIKKLAFETLPK